MIRLLRDRLRGQPCRVIGLDLLVEAAEGGLVTYPDVIVICGERPFVGPKRLVVSNPVLVVEVSSGAEDGSWLPREWNGMEAVVGCAVLLSEVFAGVAFD